MSVKFCRAERPRSVAQMEGNGVTDWQDIETAPRDGRLVELKRLYNGYLIAHGRAYFGDLTVDYGKERPDSAGKSVITFRGVWIDPGLERPFSSPTHWRPISDAVG